MQRAFNLQAEKRASLKIGIASFVLILIFIFGSIGYHLIEKLSWFEGFYMTFITISTIGFTEIKNLSVEGRIFLLLSLPSSGLATHFREGSESKHGRDFCK